MGLFGKKKEEKSCCVCAQETKAQRLSLSPL